MLRTGVYLRDHPTVTRELTSPGTVDSTSKSKDREMLGFGNLAILAAGLGDYPFASHWLDAALLARRPRLTFYTNTNPKGSYS